MSRFSVGGYVVITKDPALMGTQGGYRAATAVHADTATSLGPAPSDRNLKFDIAPVSDPPIAARDIARLVCSYYYKPIAGQGTDLRVGIIAQELQALAETHPQLASLVKAPTDSDFLHVDMISTIMLLMQSLAQHVDTLTNEITSLKRKLGLGEDQ